MVLSFTFRELGQEAIMSGKGWFTCVVLRSSILATVLDGQHHAPMSACKLRFQV